MDSISEGTPKVSKKMKVQKKKTLTSKWQKKSTWSDNCSNTKVDTETYYKRKNKSGPCKKLCWRSRIVPASWPSSSPVPPRSSELLAPWRRIPVGPIQVDG